MDKTEFAKRRQRLMDQMDKDSIAILPTAPEYIRNRDVGYPYRPDSDFYYLTGFPEPQAIAVLMPGRAQGQYILFCREKNKEKEIWTGFRAGIEGACEIYGADDAFPINDIDDIIPGLLESCHRLYYPMGYYREFDEKITSWINQLRSRARQGVCIPQETVALDYLLHEMRLRKTEAELVILQKAADVAVSAHKRLMRFCRPGLYEYQLEAEFIHEMLMHGSRAPSYSPIIAGGLNACTLHYTSNHAELKNGELVLIDAGVEYDYYASDITRTFPINGYFTEAQKILYNVVLKVQKIALNKVKPGNRWNEPHEAAIRAVTEELRELGLLLGKVDTLIDEEAYKRFYMHRIGHWLGMDVHDVGEYKVNEAWRELEPGMVMTVEPGIYIPESFDIDSYWWNIGIRIEDMVVVTETGHKILTADLPKTVEQIEAFMAGDGI